MIEDHQAQESGAPNPVTAAGVSASETKPNSEKSDSNIERVQRRHNSEREKLLARIADLEAKTKTDQEKAVDEAYRRGRSEVESLIMEKETSFALERELLKRGLDPDLAPAIRAKAELEKPGDVPDAVDSWLKGRDWVERIKAPTPPPGQSGAPAMQRASTLTLADVRKMSREDYMARADEINEGINSGRIR